jgi:hypothetical protein
MLMPSRMTLVIVVRMPLMVVPWNPTLGVVPGWRLIRLSGLRALSGSS